MSYLTVTGATWIGKEPAEEAGLFWAENEAAQMEVERSDSNEIRLGIKLVGGGLADSDSATFFLTVAEASRLAHMLGVAVLDES